MRWRGDLWYSDKNKARARGPDPSRRYIVTMASAIIVVVIFVLLALAIMFICQNGGWQGGCGGNCASCHQHCSDKEKQEKKK